MRSIARWQIFAARPRRGPAQPAAKSTSPSRLGPLPKWNLADLYGGIDDPHVKPNLDRASAESVTFEECLRAQAPHGTQGSELAADRLSALVRSAVGEPRGGGRAQARCAYAIDDNWANSLYAVYERAAEGFAERYLAMLAADCTKRNSERLLPRPRL